MILSTPELIALMKRALTDDESALVLGDYLEERGIKIPQCLATQGLVILSESESPENKARLVREQRAADVRVGTRTVLRELGELEEPS